MLRSGLAVIILIATACSPSPSSTLDAYEARRQTDVFLGAALNSNYANIQRAGDTLRYRGAPQAGCLSYGPYAKKQGSDVMLIPSIEFAAHFQPEIYETCKTRNSLNGCIAWDEHDRDHGLTVEVLGAANGQHFSIQKEFKNPAQRKIPRQKYAFEPLRFEGAQNVSGVEVRICNISTLSLDAQLYNVTLEWVWDEDVCDDPVKCPSVEAVLKYIDMLHETVPLQLKNMRLNQSYYYLAKKAEQSFACTIKKYMAGYPDDRGNLENKFLATFSKEYDESAYDCSRESLSSIRNESCSPQDVTSVCQAANGFRDNLAWLRKQQEEIERLLTTEHVRRPSESGRTQLLLSGALQELEYALQD